MNLFKILISLNPSSGFLILWGWQPNSSGDSQALRSPVLRHFLFHREPIPVAVSSSCIHPLSCQRSVLHRVFALCWSCFLSFIEWDSVCLQMVVVVGLVAKSCPILATPWTVARQAPLSMGFPRQDYWNGSPFLSPGDLPNSGIEPGSPALQAGSFLTESPWQLTFFRKSFSDIPIWIR